MNEQATPNATPTVPEGKTTPEALVNLGWTDVSGKKGKKTFIWRDANGKIVATAQISNQGYAEIV